MSKLVIDKTVDNNVLLMESIKQMHAAIEEVRNTLDTIIERMETDAEAAKDTLDQIIEGIANLSLPTNGYQIRSFDEE